MQEPLLLRFSCLLILSFLLFCSCKSDNLSQSIVGSWKLIQYENTETGEIFLEPDHIARSVVLTFDTKWWGGSFAGETVTNIIHGKFKMKAEGSIEFKEINGGLRGEPEWGGRVWPALDETHTYRIDNDIFTLVFGKTNHELVFEHIQ